MKRVLILGASGLIGHRLLKEFTNKDSFKVFATLHRSKKDYGNLDLFKNDSIIDNVNAIDFESIDLLLNDISPDFILNCIGITKRKEDILIPLISIKVNSLFPHFLANWCIRNKKKVIHFSTDCVFDGSRGNYDENSLTNAKDNYGRTKALGEINDGHNITIRSSFIGQELFRKTELLDWFLSMKGKEIQGYTGAFYSGVSTLFMSKIVSKIILDFPKLAGLFQLALDSPISKYDFLCLAKDIYNIDIDIIPNNTFIHKPTLNGARLKTIMNFQVPDWKTMLKELKVKSFEYN